MTKAEKLLGVIFEDSLFEMSNISPRDTNLPVVVWVFEKGKSKHGPRVKVMTHPGKMNLAETVSISVSDNPEVVAGEKLDPEIFNLVKKWVILNKKVLLDYWNNKLYTIDMLKGLKMI